MVRTPTGLGSRFLIHQDGYLVTNDHVIAGENQISVHAVQNYWQRTYENKLCNQDYCNWWQLDLALLKIEATKKAKNFLFVTLGSFLN